MPVKSEIKYGFWVGLGVALAFLVLAMLQVYTLKAIHREA